MKISKIYGLVLISLLYSFMAKGQHEQSSSMQEQSKQVIDSLQGLLISAETDSLRAVLYTNLSRVYLFNNRPDDAQGAAQRALDAAQKTKQHTMISNAYGVLGRFYMETSDYPASIDAYQSAIAMLGDTGYVMPKAFNTMMLGKAYESQRLLEVAEEKYKEAYELLKNNQDTSRQYLSLLSFGLNNLGNVASLQEQYEEGVKYQLEAIEVRRALGDSLNLAYSYNDIAIVYLSLEKEEEAKSYYEQAWDIFVQMGKKRELAVIGTNLAGIYLSIDQEQKALKYGLEAIQNAYDVNDQRSIMGGAGTLASIYSELGMYKEAFEAQRTYTAYRDSIFNEQRLREVGRLESKIELQEKEAENQRQQLTIEQQRTTNIIIGSALVLVLFLAGLLLRLQQQQKKANHLLQLQNEEISQQKEELSAQAEVLKEANEEINMQKEEIYAQAETLRNINQEIQGKNELLTMQNSLIEKKNTDIMSSISYASRIQGALLPFESKLQDAFKEYFILYQPRDIVSGDFYWFGEVGAKKIIAAVDCTGHGVPGAFMSMLGHGALSDIVLRKEITSPEEILDHLHVQIQTVLQQEQTENKDGMDVALCVIDTSSNKLAFAGAKNPLVMFQNGEMKVVKGDSMAIGGQNRKGIEHHFTKHEFDLNEQTSFYIYSDGFQDQFGGPQGKKLMTKHFRALLKQVHQYPMDEQRQMLQNKLDAWMGEKHRQIDDILVMGLRV